MKDYDVNEHAQYIFENGLDCFYNYLATETDLHETMWNAFDAAKQYKFAAQAGVIIKRNQWKEHAFDLLDSGNVVLWDLLRDYAQAAHDDALESLAADKAEMID